MCPAFGSLRVGLRMRRARRFSRARPAASTGSLSPRISMARAVRSATCRSTRRHWSPANCSRTFVRRCIASPTQPSTTPWSSSISVCLDGIRRAAAASAGRDRWRAHHRHRRAWIRRSYSCRGQGRARRRDAEICARRGGTRPGAGSTRRPQCKANRHFGWGDVPGRPDRHRRVARAARLGSRPSRADEGMARALRRARLRGGRRHPPLLYGVVPRIRDGRPAHRRLRSDWPRRHRRLARRH